MTLNLKAAHKQVRLSPNLTMKNSPGRDTKMYQLSDLSNLEHKKYLKGKNALDKFLEIESVLPHKNSLALGFRKGSNYDNVIERKLQDDFSKSSLGISAKKTLDQSIGSESRGMMGIDSHRSRTINYS